MATVITITPKGEVRIEVDGQDAGCPPSDLVRQIDLARAVHVLQQGQDRTDQFVKVLGSRIEAVYRAVRKPGKIVVSYGPPEPENQE